MLLICPDCQVQLRCQKIGVPVELFTSDFFPYQLFATDLYACPVCTKRVLINPVERAIAEHHQDDYSDLRQSLKPELQFWSSVKERDAAVTIVLGLNKEEPK